MRVRIAHLIVVLAISVAVLVAPVVVRAEDGFARVDGKQILDGSGKPLYLRGMNLGMWLVPEGYQFQFGKEADRPTTIEALTNDLLGAKDAEVFWRRWRDNFVGESDIKDMAQWGFNSIRLPFHYRIISPKYGTYSDQGFSYLDRVVKWAAKYGIYVIFDMHCAPGGQTGTNIDDSNGTPEFFDSPDNLKWAAATWAAIARRYKDNPTVMGYDLLNEPVAPQFDYNNSQLEPAYREIASAIRKYDTNHILFIEGAQWATNFSVFGDPIDQNMVYSFHKYWNDNNVQSIAGYLNVRSKSKVPLWLGETGENTTDWYSAMASLVWKYDIGFAFWTWKKLGAKNCPYTIPTPMYWEEIVAYTNGGARPHPVHSKMAFEQLATFVKFQNCYINPDVVAALVP